MTHEQHRHGALLGVFEQGGSTLTDLRHRTRRVFQSLAINSLDRIDYNHVGLHCSDLRKYFVQPCLAEQHQVAFGCADAIRAELDLPFALLATHIKNLAV